MDRVNKTLIEIEKCELNNLFEIIVCYFKSGGAGGGGGTTQTMLVFSSERTKLWQKVNLIILKFSKFIQKHLQRCLITCEESSIDQW